ncbi:MAG: GNAT family N-acetyltransferase [Candidatus Latescibacteria bacterium]|nr:GNAT family N-acetyltransferase [Candidatus Latescibacterota bacterium]
MVDPPYVKDYDVIKGEEPTRWARRFDVSNWGILSAHIDGQRVGGIIMAWNTDGFSMLEDRSDLAVIWDVRVDDAARGQGVGRTLSGAGEQWARERGCKWLKVETQNINVDACRFYAKMGCHLGAINQHAYEDLPDEVQMLWVKQL